MRANRAWVGLLGLSALVGCSSSSNDPFGPTPDFGRVEAQFQQPTGTFAKGSEASIVGGLAKQQASSSDGFGLGGASSSGSSNGGVTTKTFDLLDTKAGGTGFCDALKNGADSGSCACPNGGSLAYDMSGMQQMRDYKGGPIDVTLKVRANACTVQDVSIDGTEFAKIKSSGTPNAQDLLMLFDLHLTVSARGQTERIDADFEYLNGKLWFSIGVDDGNVVVATEHWDGTTKTGTIHVKDRNESWTCVFTNGKGTCTSDKGGSRDVSGL